MSKKETTVRVVLVTKKNNLTDAVTGPLGFVSDCVTHNFSTTASSEKKEWEEK